MIHTHFLMPFSCRWNGWVRQAALRRMRRLHGSDWWLS